MELVLMVLAFVLAMMAVKGAVTYACNDWTAEEREYQRKYRRARKRNRREAMKLQRKAIQWGTAIDTAIKDARKGEAR